MRSCLIWVVVLTTVFVGAHDDFIPFAESFLGGYCVNPESRFSREYHPYLLRKTQTSMHELETHLRQNGFALDGRLLIMGYEHNAMPNYFDCLSQDIIDDETVIKTTGGWEFAPGNLFGFLTGYLFKDIACTDMIEHSGTDRIELFRESLPLLQRHAFGGWAPLIASYQAHVQEKVLHGTMTDILTVLMRFWQSIYEAESKNVQGRSFATQDILFSLYYAQYIQQSSVPIQRLFLGADLTYPIEVVEQQLPVVTRNAQAFAKRFTSQLCPRSGQKTAYIFESFVDGVGKSTLLGNVRNWQRVADQFDAYEHVSNTSSQRAALYQFADDVIIVDLPAQVSHYCAKPDGSVYVDVGFCKKLDHQQIMCCCEYVATHAAQLRKDMIERQEQIADGGAVQSPEDQMISLVHTLGCASAWCPFIFENNHYVFNVHDQRQIRVLVSLDDAHSQGLKIREPELMIFDQGLSIPMRYDHFMNDLVDQLTTAGVKQVVFVDFLSMYPRTSRETIRINYMLQQLKRLCAHEFDIQASVYRAFTSPHELYALFFDQRDRFEQALFWETLMRWVVYDTITSASYAEVRRLNDEQMTARMQEKITQLCHARKPDLDQVIRMVRTRIQQEEPRVAPYQMSRYYEAISRFSVERFEQCADMVRSLIAQYHPDDQIRSRFGDLSAEVASVIEQGRRVELSNGIKLEVVQLLDAYTLDRALLEQLVPWVRTMWYNQLVSLVVPELNSFDKQAVVVKKMPDGRWYVLLYRASDWQEPALHLAMQVQHFGLAVAEWFDAPPLMNTIITDIMKLDYQELSSDQRDQFFVSTERLCSYLNEHALWQPVLKEEHGLVPPRHERVGQELIALMVQALATIHCVIKDVNDEIMVRYGCQADFIAALYMLEYLVLPKYLEIDTKGVLFDDYNAVAPLVGAFVAPKE